MRISAWNGTQRVQVIGAKVAIWPMATPGLKKVEFSAAMEMSESETNIRPPPLHIPLTAAMTGLVNWLWREVSRAPPPLPGWRCWPQSGEAAASLTSMPEQKARSPAPVKITTFTFGSSWRPAHIAGSPTWIISLVRAFSRWGLFRVTVAMPSAFSMRMSSSAMACFLLSTASIASRSPAKGARKAACYSLVLFWPQLRRSRCRR